jgi:hypothetical protein
MASQAVPIGHDRRKSPATGSLQLHPDPLALPGRHNACEFAGVSDRVTRSLGWYGSASKPVEGAGDTWTGPQLRRTRSF